MARVNFVVNEDKKRVYEQYVEKSAEYESLSQFFRSSAQKEINHDEDGKAEPAPEVLSRINDLEEDLDSVKEQLALVLTHVAGDEREEDVDLPNSILETIPVAPQPTSAEVANSAKSREELERQHIYAALEGDAPSTIEGLARFFNKDQSEIKNAIERLKSNFQPITSFVDEEGKKHYLKEAERK